MRVNSQQISEHDDGTYVVKKSRKSNILAFILCLLVAFVIWAYAASFGSDSPSGTDTEQTDAV